VGRAPSVLVVPTDFSPLADRALAVGYSLLESGGTLHLVHVADRPSDQDRARCLEQLKARIPVDAAARGIGSELQILEGSSPWIAIWQQASRASADMICMATHSREGVAGLVLGSQAQALLQHSRIPVVLVPPDRED
jgi:nucleotide-binding universal stress UspA family protein